MEFPMTAIELTGTIDKNNQLKLDGVLPFSGPKRVRIIVLSAIDDEIDEIAWLKAASVNPSFAFLNDSEEDIYSLEDGEAFHAEI